MVDTTIERPGAAAAATRSATAAASDATSRLRGVIKRILEADEPSEAMAELGPALARVEAILAAEDVPGTSASYQRGHLFMPLEEQHSADLFARYKAAAAEVGFEVDGEFTGGCADSGFTGALGVPSLCGLGPVGGAAHTEREWCRLETLVPRAQALAVTIAGLEG